MPLDKCIALRAMISGMKIREWRIANSKSLRQAAEAFGIGGGKNPSRRMQRIETGEAPVDALLADVIVTITNGAVTLQDLNDTRRDFMQNARAEVA